LLLPSGRVTDLANAVEPGLTSVTCGFVVHKFKTTEQALAGFFRDLAASATRLADELDTPTPSDSGTDLSSLGFLQRWIARTPEMYTEQGVTARRIMEVIGRNDEPNVRSSLDGMIRRGFAELVPGHTRPLRFRMTERFREEGPPAG
jgi:hypothetical protein